MSQFWIIVFVFFFLLPDLFGQAKSSIVEKQIMEIKLLCQSVHAENILLKSHIRTQDSLAYARMRMDIFEAYNVAPRIKFDFLNTTDKIAVTGLFAKLLQANNPTSDILGFRFSETVMKASEKCFKNELTSESEKSRFGQVLTKLVNNPVISALAYTNPITTVTASIISMVAGFSTTSVDVLKDGTRLKDVTALTTDAFSQKNIETFKMELQPYINFYDALNIASTRYLTGLDNINGRYVYLKGTVESYKLQLYSSLSINDTNTLMNLANLLPDPANKNYDYSRLLSNPKIQVCAGIARQMPAIQLSVKDFKLEYEQTLLTFLKEYITALQSAKKLPSESIDQLKIEGLINDIQIFIKNDVYKEKAEKQ